MYLVIILVNPIPIWNGSLWDDLFRPDPWQSGLLSYCRLWYLSLHTKISGINDDKWLMLINTVIVNDGKWMFIFRTVGPCWAHPVLARSQIHLSSGPSVQGWKRLTLWRVWYGGRILGGRTMERKMSWTPIPSYLFKESQGKKDQDIKG